MCSISEDYEELNACNSEETAVNLRFCKRCEESQGDVILRKKEVYCKKCFLVYCTHTFRATLGKNKSMHHSDQVLVAFSGSESSASLLHLIKEGMEESTHKRLMFSVQVLYVDEGSVLEMSEKERISNCQSIFNFVNSCGFNLFYCTISDIFSNKILCFKLSEGFDLSFLEESEISIKEMFANLSSLTAKVDYLSKLRNNMIIECAKQLNCNKIFTAETMTDISVNILSNISLGRGSQLLLDAGFIDTRYPDHLILRPMRNFSKKQVVFYNVFNNISGINIPSLSTKMPSHSSIQQLTQTFVTELQKDFSGTISTIFRTGEKVTTDNKSQNEELCVLCNSLLDTSKSVSSSLESTKFSGMISKFGSLGFNVNDAGKRASDIEASNKIPSVCEKDTCSCANSKQIKEICVTKQDLGLILCYGCQLIIRDLNSVEKLPKNFLHSVKNNLNFQQMKEEIKDYLL